MLILKILFRNAFRNKLRTGLTLLGITIAILAFGLLRTVINAWHAGVEASSATRLVTRNSISIIFSLPLSYKEKIRQTTGVKTASYGTWFGGVYIEEKNFFPNFAVEPQTFLDLYPEYVLSPQAREAFFKDRKGFVAGRKLVERFGWKIGDIVTLKGTIFLGDWDFVLRGIYRGRDKTTDETQFFFHWEYLNETLKKRMPHHPWVDQVGYYMVGVTRPDLGSSVSAAIDSTFKNSLAETLTETEKAFQQSFVSMSGTIITAIQIVSMVVIIIILAVVANTMAMTTRERIGEYAVLKTLGFGKGHIAGLIFGESFVITMMGCTLGILTTFPAAKAFRDALGNYFPVFNVEPKTLILDLVAALVVATGAGIVPTARAIQIRIADGLRRIG
jgi:putative ABC transport system permease protein